ncbi:MAG: hypothetical protein ACRDN9_14560 [Streptosporangiaceae bacterium]
MGDWARLRLWPEHASEDYVSAREDLLRAEVELRDHRERVAVLRRKLPPGGTVPDYVFTEGPRDLDADERGIDLLWPVWQVPDPLPEGRGEWYPSYAYADRGRG